MAFSIVIYGMFNFNFLVLFLAFVHLIGNLFKSLFSHFLLVSKWYELSLCQSFFFLIKLHTIKPATLLKRDFSTDVLV